ncbi:hypothetical protein LPJ64_005819, partial [Coemansia asiatica]
TAMLSIESIGALKVLVKVVPVDLGHSIASTKANGEITSDTLLEKTSDRLQGSSRRHLSK